MKTIPSTWVTTTLSTTTLTTSTYLTSTTNPTTITLTPSSTARTSHMSRFPKRTLIFSTTDALFAQHISALLEHQGFSAEVKNVGIADGAVPRILAPFEVWVEQSRFEEAEACLETALSKDEHNRLPWTCVACGEVSEAQFTECWNCGNSQNS